MKNSQANEATFAANAANKRALRALVIPIGKAAEPVAGEDVGPSKALPEDPFHDLIATQQLIDPPFDMLTLSMLPEHNTELGPAIEAMEINIEGFGHILKPRVDVENAPDAAVAEEVRKERVRLENFFAYASIDDSFTMLRRKRRRDLEATGNAYWEVIRSASGMPQGFVHIPSYQMRLGRLDSAPIPVDVPILELQDDGSVKITKIKVWKRFRKFAQAKPYSVRQSGSNVRWFKEFGDPRVMDCDTGEFLEGEKAEALPEERRANEIVHWRLYSTRSPYGLPRYIGNLLSIFGDRAAEEINFVTFRNNNIPSMIIAVANGQLTEGSIDRIKEFSQSQIQGSDNRSKFLILEAEASGDDFDDSGRAKIEIKPLTSEQHNDAMFQKYSSNNKSNVRRAFRLPPIFLGHVEDLNVGVVDASRRLADEQVFAPERAEFDNWVNRRLLPEMGIVFHRFRSNHPNTTDNKELVAILSGSEKTGGMTPRIARTILQDVLGQELPDFKKDERFDPDLPFSLSMAEAVKNMADPAEPGQQVTALKVLKALEERLDAPKTLDQRDAIDSLLEIKRQLEERWRAEVVESDD